ncbi:MarR family transcriptional regulator [Pelobacter propionicus]|uniref:Putative transcriptional regulator n=1 Tax=Pelobacter propionicus (strain DSM 2379 / NBRC 103807 / OttBd1) TaxID=338966 RepID=A1ANH6_PELPD|nr:transcriptional regulator [Pelobacter propionicus]ABK98896.1 putative transcriptional regulator [Pelobacter propionicus DSM 2379]
MTGVNNLTVEKIRVGNSNIRKPILVSCVAKGLLPYHGLGSGIKRAQEKWQAIDFPMTTVHRHSQRQPVEELDFIRSNPAVSYDELADMTPKDRTTVMRNIGRLKDVGILRRVGSKKTGRWEVIE